jgi:hypothetical protein
VSFEDRHGSRSHPRAPRQGNLVVPVVTAWVTENLDRVPWPHPPMEPIHLLGPALPKLIDAGSFERLGRDVSANADE